MTADPILARELELELVDAARRRAEPAVVYALPVARGVSSGRLALAAVAGAVLVLLTLLMVVLAVSFVAH